MRRWFLLLVIQVAVISGTYQNYDNFEQYDTDKGGNGREIHRASFPDRLKDLCEGIEAREIHRASFPDRLKDLCEGIEDHEHVSDVKLAGTVYFPVTDTIDCDVLGAGVSTNSRMLHP